MLRWEQASVSLVKTKVMQLMSRMSLEISTGESVCVVVGGEGGELTCIVIFAVMHKKNQSLKAMTVT